MTLRPIPSPDGGSSGGIVECQCIGCPTRFVSYSMVSIVREQAKLAGWGRVAAWTITDADTPMRKYDVCPVHLLTSEENRAERPKRKAEAKAERERLRLEAAKAKAEARDAKRVARLTAKLAEQRAREIARRAKQLGEVP